MRPEVHAVVAVHKTEVLHPFGFIFSRRSSAARAESTDTVCTHQQRRDVMQDAVNLHDVMRAFAKIGQTPVGRFEIRIASHQVQRRRPHFKPGDAAVVLCHHAATSAADAGHVNRDSLREILNAGLQSGVGWVGQRREVVFRLGQQACGVVTEKQCFVMVAFMLTPVHVSRQSDAKKVTEQRLLSGMVSTGHCPTCSGSVAVAVIVPLC